MHSKVLIQIDLKGLEVERGFSPFTLKGGKVENVTFAGRENSIQRRLRAKSPLGDLGAKGEKSSKGRK